MKAWAGMHRVMIELTPIEARSLAASRPESLWSADRDRLAYLADVADGIVIPTDAADRPAMGEGFVQPTGNVTFGAEVLEDGRDDVAEFMSQRQARKWAEAASPPVELEGTPSSGPAEIVVRDNSGQVVREVLCACSECVAAYIAKFGR
ncbi:hypothetical protein GCM10007304_18000 [Rhodococcoides trifolii]|uniref:Uncharacterized protein n=1 Tax=Rhodococcoides trifolii TaxID=908250 RepID=A0A917FUP6_9NOCA|nr:hypothetical protein [Rhodococcus trifolii]GGG04271.1 hypothetical protein GCM10007304_18000 [Rhodococcus trifolii]